MGDGVEYLVLGCTAASKEWFIANVGLRRNEAVAEMVMRAMRWNEWRGVGLLERILDGSVDPEKPSVVEGFPEPGYGPPNPLWLCIAPEASPRPPLPPDRHDWA